MATKSLIPLIQRGADIYEKPYLHALKIWDEAMELSDTQRVLGGDDYFLPLCDIERYLRKNPK